MKCMHLKNFKVFPSLRRPGTPFRHGQGHHRTGAVTGSISIFQSTIITVYQVEHPRTVNTKIGKQTSSFSVVIIEFYHCFSEAYQSILQIFMAEKYKHF